MKDIEFLPVSIKELERKSELIPVDRDPFVDLRHVVMVQPGTKDKTGYFMNWVLYSKSRVSENPFKAVASQEVIIKPYRVLSEPELAKVIYESWDNVVAKIGAELNEDDFSALYVISNSDLKERASAL